MHTSEPPADGGEQVVGGPEESHTSPADGDTDTEREQGLDWPADPDELTGDDPPAAPQP